ncbi:pilus assembly protein PilP, partial [Kaarinaea lacus]
MKQFLTQTLRERRTDSTRPGHASLSKIVGQCMLMIPLAVGLVACGGAQDQDLRNYVNEVKARKKGSIPPLPEPQKFEIFSYDEASVRDPFIPTQVIEAAANSG